MDPAPAQEIEKPRVRVEGEHLVVGGEKITKAILEGWHGWGYVERAVKKMVKADGKSLTTGELDTIRGLATTPAAKNGLTEFEQAVAQSIL